jgi:hypothetical protein
MIAMLITMSNMQRCSGGVAMRAPSQKRSPSVKGGMAKAPMLNRHAWKRAAAAALSLEYSPLLLERKARPTLRLRMDDAGRG